MGSKGLKKIRKKTQREESREPSARIPRNKDELFLDYSLAELEKALDHEETYTDEDMAYGTLKEVISHSVDALLQPRASKVKILSEVSLIILSYERRMEKRRKTVKLLKKRIRDLK